jgi:hypothetical protein
VFCFGYQQRNNFILYILKIFIIGVLLLEDDDVGVAKEWGSTKSVGLSI